MIAERLTGGEQTELKYPLKKLPHPLDLDVAGANAKAVNQAFASHGTRLWLVFGTLLGCVRDNALIPWDGDVDFGVYDSDLERVHEVLIDLGMAGFRIIRSLTENDRDCLISIERNGYYCDFYVMTPYEKGWSWGKRIEKGDWFTTLRRWPGFLGEDWWVPDDYEGYLVEHYDHDWRTPKRKFLGNLLYKPGSNRRNEYRRYIRGGV